MAGHAQARPQGLARLALVAGLVALLAALLTAGRAVAPDNAVAQVTCPPTPAGLSPQGGGPGRFTMLIRINTAENVEDYTKNPPDADSTPFYLGNRIGPQDIFVLNTRFEGAADGNPPPMTQAIATDLANQLKTAFPCNRIIALNGLSFDPAAPGFAFSLYDHPGVWALMTDFEPMDWNAGAATDPGRPGWSYKYRTALARIKSWIGNLSTTLSIYPQSTGKRAGLVPIDVEDWNFGQIAQGIDKKNRRLGGRHLGPQSVQTQDACANLGASGFADRYDELKDEYRFKFIKRKVFRKGKKRKITVRRKLKKKARPSRANLAVQISFSHNPTGGAMAITKTSAALADACVAAGLQQGAGAFFFFASTEAMNLIFQQPTVASLRPASFKK
jgi:hypothetical protein